MGQESKADFTDKKQNAHFKSSVSCLATKNEKKCQNFDTIPIMLGKIRLSIHQILGIALKIMDLFHIDNMPNNLKTTYAMIAVIKRVCVTAARRWGLSLLFGVSLCTSTFNASAAQFNPENISWSELTFSASVLFFTVDAEIKFKKLPVSQAVSDLINPNPVKSELVMPAQQQVYYLSSHTAKFGRNSTLEFWFEGDLTALQRTQTETGRKTIVRTYRFLQDGAYRKDRLPAQGEEKSPPANWSKTSSEFYPYPDALPSYKMTDNNVIFYAMSAAELYNKGDRVVFLTFDKEHINQVEIVLQGTKEIQTEYVAHTKNGKKRVRETVNALRLSIQSEPVNKNIDKEEFVFLGVKGDISLYIHPKTRIPLQVSGDADYIGQTDITLSRAVLAE